MSDLFSGKPLELEVTNFGPIVEAKIDLRPLTVFIGPSNTGKSYLAILIYALHRFFSGDEQFGGRSLFPYSTSDHKRNKLSKETLNNLREWAEGNLSDREEVSDKNEILVPDPVAGLIRSAFNGFNSMGDPLGSEINRCFGISDIKTLVREGKRDGASVVIRRHVLDDSRPFVHKLTINASHVMLNTVIPEQIPMRLKRMPRRFGLFDDLSSLRQIIRDMFSSHTSKNYKNLEHDMWYLIQHLSIFATHHVVGFLDSPAFYLPADRTGVMHAHTVVVNALIRSAAMVGLRSASAPTPILSGVLADFLEQLIDLSNQPRRRHKPRNGKSDLGSRIEEKVLHGSVHTKKSEFGYPSFTYQPEGWKGEDLPLMNASSMVSELAPVVLYLRHIVRRGDVLIVEEPESHLHPAMQVEFTRQLATIVRSGVRVIVTTHSEWLLEELANLVQLSELSSNRRSEIKYGGEALRPDEVGVWLFEQKNRPKGSVVKEISLNKSGLFPSGFSDVASALHNDWAEISSQIEKNQ